MIATTTNELLVIVTFVYLTIKERTAIYPIPFIYALTLFS